MHDNRIPLRSTADRRRLLGLAGAAALLSLSGSRAESGHGAPVEESPLPLSSKSSRLVATHRYGSLANAQLGVGAPLNGAVPFPVDNAWNRVIRSAPVAADSAKLIANSGLAGAPRCHLGARSGIPYVVVSAAQRPVPVRFTFPEHSDGGPYPIPRDALVELGWDRRMLVIDRDDGCLFELYGACNGTHGSWDAGSGAIFRLDSNDPRPQAAAGWMSADPSGLPIFPGLIRFDEARAGVIPHALRFAAPRTRRAFVAPATSWGMALDDDPRLLPMGARLRLRSTYRVSRRLSIESKAILQALQTYGMFLSETAFDWGFTGAPDARWDGERIADELSALCAADFEVVEMTGIVTA